MSILNGIVGTVADFTLQSNAGSIAEVVDLRFCPVPKKPSTKPPKGCIAQKVNFVGSCLAVGLSVSGLRAGARCFAESTATPNGKPVQRFEFALPLIGC